MALTRERIFKVVILLTIASSLYAASTEEAFKHADKNKDGIIDREEFESLAGDIFFELQDLLGDRGEYEPSPEYTYPTFPQINAKTWGGFVSGLGMVIATELGDKTFFIAAIMAMQFSRALVFGGAISALAVMTILSAALGYALPNFLPREYTHYAGAFLFLYFGLRMLKEGFDAESSGPSDELAEVEQELSMKRPENDQDIEQYKPSKGQPNSQVKGPFSIFTQAFTLTFLAEWGDRSQVATIALAASKDVVGVTIGGILGHSLCTGMAVIGGRLLASRISEKTVHLFGGALFLVFGVHSLVFGL